MPLPYENSSSGEHAIETGVLSFEGAFLGQILLPNGKTIFEQAQATNLLPAPEGAKS
jgi:hypothetical protein